MTTEQPAPQNHKLVLQGSGTNHPFLSRSGSCARTCSATLLVIVLDGLADGVVDDEPDVGFVDAHAERHRGHDNLQSSTVFDTPSFRGQTCSSTPVFFSTVLFFSFLHGSNTPGSNGHLGGTNRSL